MKMEHLRGGAVVAVLGGGVAGAVTAWHLARALPPGAAEIVVVEPREVVGPGLAYSTSDPAHRINVAAAKMSLVAEEPEHFMAWLAATRTAMSPGTLTLGGEFYPERRIFGAYVAAQLAPVLAGGAIRHVRARAVSAARSGQGYRLGLSDGTTLAADVVVLAMSHPRPALPQAFLGLARSRRLIADPYDGEAIAGIGPTDRVLILGTALTSADVVASLGRRGFRGEIVALSRRGLRSRGHGAPAGRSAADFVRPPAPTARALLRRIRAAIAAEAAEGRGWQATIDRVRDQGQAIWANLDAGERARLLRHLRPFWDVHRFRVAPQVEEVLVRQEAVGRLGYAAARVVRASEAAAGIFVEYRRRGHAGIVAERFDRVVVTTGPAHDAVLQGNPVLSALAAEGLLCPDPLGLGLRVAGRCRAVDAGGGLSETLFVAGPLARGDVGELMGVPEVAAHARTVAEAIAGRLLAMRGAPHADLEAAVFRPSS